MSTSLSSAAARYDHALRYGRDRRLAAGSALPQPSSAWPTANVALLEAYQQWLLSSGTSPYTIGLLYIPMAGHALGLNLEPHASISLDADVERALDYVKAKRLSAQWTDMCRVALGKFRRFLRQQRGLCDVVIRDPDLARYRVGLPAWLTEPLERYQHLMQRNWRPARLSQQTMRLWSGHTRLWHWLFEHHAIDTLADIKRQHLFAYIDQRLASGHAASSVNQDLRCFHAFLLYLQTQDWQVPQSLLRLPVLKQPDSLPRFLTDEQVGLLRDEFERRLAQAHTPGLRRDALLDRAAFYLLWQGGLRLGEAEELHLEDLGLPGRKLTVRQAKGLKDRTVFLADPAVQALRDSLAVRGMGATSHVFLYRNEPLHKDLIHSRIRAAGQRAGVQVSPHRLRHTCATQLLNAGCRVTSIQRLLGHRRLNSTMIYARVHDQTVADDYYSAMARIEQRLCVASESPAPTSAPSDPGHASPELARLFEQLEGPELSLEARLALVAGLRSALHQEVPEPVAEATNHSSLSL